MTIYKYWLIYKNIVLPVLTRSKFKSIYPQILIRKTYLKINFALLNRSTRDLSYLNKQEVHSLRKIVLVSEKIIKYKT